MNNPERFTNYSVDDAGDVRLTEWMMENLRLSLWLCPPGVTLSEVEDEVLKHWNPPLNGKGVKNEWRPLVSQARKSMSVEASQWQKP